MASSGYTTCYHEGCFDGLLAAGKDSLDGVPAAALLKCLKCPSVRATEVVAGMVHNSTEKTNWNSCTNPRFRLNGRAEALLSTVV